MNWLLFLTMIRMTMSNIRSKCPDHCACNAPNVECYKTLPSFIPENVSSVTAHEVPLEPYMNFTIADWHNVTYLSLSLGNENETKPLHGRTLQDYEFTGLTNLQYLHLLCHCHLKVNSSAFYGLINVSVLDLSNNVIASLTSDIVTALKGEDIVPNISELYLSNITHSWFLSTSQLDLGLDNLHIAMENKPLQVLDLSGNNIYFCITQSHTPPPLLLPQLHTLNISRAGQAVFSLSDIYKYYTQRPEAVFSNLQVLDASYPYFPLSQSECEESYDYYWQFCKTGQHTTNFLPFNLTELFLPNIFASQISELRGKFNSTHLCITTKIFSTNNTICVGANFEHIKNLDISNNSFNYIQPELLHALKSLKYLNVSNNKLAHTLADGKYARPFFHALKFAETLQFQNNNITILPNKTLEHNTKLKQLDLSHNRLTTVNFGLNYLSELRILDLSHNRLTSLDLRLKGQVSLELLDMSYNRIEFVDSGDCELLKHLQFNSNTSNTNYNDGKTGLRLEGNPLRCSCNNLCLFNFLLDQNETLTCYSDEKTHNASFWFVKHLEYSCKKGIVIAAFVTDAVLTLMIIGLAICTCSKKREKKDQNEKTERKWHRAI